MSCWLLPSVNPHGIIGCSGRLERAVMYSQHCWGVWHRHCSWPMTWELVGALHVPAGCGELCKEQCRALSLGQEQQLCEEHKWQGELSELSETEPRTRWSLVPFPSQCSKPFAGIVDSSLYQQLHFKLHLPVSAGAWSTGTAFQSTAGSASASQEWRHHSKRSWE